MDDERVRYFHLLRDGEIRALGPLLDALHRDRDGVLSRWHELYVGHFPQVRALNEGDFRAIFGLDLEANVRNLAEVDMARFESDTRALGNRLLDRGVAFAEAVAIGYLFEECLEPHLGAGPPGAALRVTLGKLSHCRMILLATTYFTDHPSDRYSIKKLGIAPEAADGEHDRARRTKFHGLVGTSAPMRRLYEQIAAAAGGQGAVMIVGESGTGKEIVARAIHERSGVSARPFVAVNCAALPRELIESELFGYRRGAYTGAQAEHAGLVRAASGGTLFLDEITEMTNEVQAKLLRVLEEHAVRPVGGAQEVPVVVRFVTSTNRNPEKAVVDGLLREDLYYRLNVHRIEIPPLRKRAKDIPELVLHFAELFARLGLRKAEAIDDAGLGVLLAHSWSGNVRELRNVVEHALTAGKGPRILAADLPSYLARVNSAGGSAGASGEIPTLEAAERELIERALQATAGNKLQAAKLLRISRHRLYDRLRRYRIDRS